MGYGQWGPEGWGWIGAGWKGNRGSHARGTVDLDDRAADLTQQQDLRVDPLGAILISAIFCAFMGSAARPPRAPSRPAKLSPRRRYSGLTQSFLSPTPALLECMEKCSRQEYQPTRMPIRTTWFMLDSGQAKARPKPPNRTGLQHSGNKSAAPTDGALPWMAYRNHC